MNENTNHQRILFVCVLARVHAVGTPPRRRRGAALRGRRNLAPRRPRSSDFIGCRGLTRADLKIKEYLELYQYANSTSWNRVPGHQDLITGRRWVRATGGIVGQPSATDSPSSPSWLPHELQDQALDVPRQPRTTGCQLLHLCAMYLCTPGTTVRYGYSCKVDCDPGGVRIPMCLQHEGLPLNAGLGLLEYYRYIYYKVICTHSVPLSCEWTQVFLFCNIVCKCMLWFAFFNECLCPLRCRH